tara:strand:- start:3 stop:251 length:249 start_codon:yes stop_codon:yes gene_type:complete
VSGINSITLVGEYDCITGPTVVAGVLTTNADSLLFLLLLLHVSLLVLSTFLIAASSLSHELNAEGPKTTPLDVLQRDDSRFE